MGNQYFLEFVEQQIETFRTGLKSGLPLQFKKMTQVFYSEISVKDAKRLVRLYHYSHNPSLMPAYTATWHIPGGLFGKHGPAIAAAVYNHPVGGGKIAITTTNAS
jgi:hypothetical protein